MGFEIEGMLTARPFNGRGWSVERQQCGGCAMRQPHRRWHVLSYYPERGVAVCRTSRWGKGDAPLPAGALGLYPAGEAEAVSWLGTQIKALHVHLSPELLAAASLEQTGAARRNLPYLFSFKHKLLNRWCDELYELTVSQPRAGREAQAIIDQILIILGCDFAIEGEAPQRRIGLLKSSELLDMMHGGPAISVGVDDLARRSGVGRSRFYRAFRTLTGASPHDYLVRSRLEYAKRHLQAGDMRLAEIAIASGFTDQSHFTNTFKKRLGLTPGAFADWFAKP